jgi:PHD/YefM family antitoxin component YafN of YafNO toxin-antitoxin module
MGSSYNSVMKTVDVSEAGAKLDSLLDEAQSQPIILRSGGRDVAAVISMADFELVRAAQVSALLRASDSLAASARANGLTAEKLEPLLTEPD